MRDIAEHIVEALSAGNNVVLVTVVGSKGSTPRNAGSQMLVSEAGLICGTIGGGAIEGHAIAKARTMVGEDTLFCGRSSSQTSGSKQHRHGLRRRCRSFVCSYMYGR